MKKTNSIKNESASLEISKLMIGNLMVLLAGILGYLTGYLTFIHGNDTEELPKGGDNDAASYHFNSES